MALAKQDEGTKKKNTQTVTVGGRTINVPAPSNTKSTTTPKPSNTSNVTVGGRTLSQSQKEDKTVSNAIKNTAKSVANNVANNAKAKVQQEQTSFISNNKQSQQQGEQLSRQFVQQSNPQTRSDFKTDYDYEKYLLDNKIDYTQGDAFQYLKEKSQEEGTTSRNYLEGMRTRYKNAKETEKIEKDVREGKYTEEELADINNRYYVLLDENGNEADLQKYENDSNLVGQTYDEINKKIEKLNKDYTDGKIDYQTMQGEYDRLTSLWNENTANAERLQSYRTVSGFDYYDWAKSQGKDVSDFEAYAENYDDNALERLMQAYGASWWDTLSVRPEKVALVRTLIDPDYDIRTDAKVSNQMKQTANELKEYAFAGSTGFERWSVQGLSALFPMINEVLISKILPLEQIATLQAGMNGTVMTAEETARVVKQLTDNIVNVNLGIQKAGEVLRQRLDEGNNRLTSVADATIHGVITAMVEGMDAGSTVDFLGNGVGKYLASMAIFGKPSTAGILANMALAGHNEGKEEVIESLGTFVADSVFNGIAGIADSLGIDALEKVSVDPINVADLANEYAMAFYGTAVLGIPSSAGTYINTKKQYNAVMRAKEHFESVLQTPLASKLEKTLAQKSLENINFGLNTSKINESEVAKAVEIPDDNVEPLPTYDQLMSDFANAMRPDVQDDMARVQQTIAYSYDLRNRLQNELNARGVEATVDRFMSEDNKTRSELLNASKFLNSNNIEHFIGKLQKGVNGVNTANGILLNTDQSKSFDIEKIAQMDDSKWANYEKRINDAYDDEIGGVMSDVLIDAGLNPSIVSSSFHETAHFAERSELWNKMRNMVESMMGKEQFNKATDRIMRLYRAQGIDVANPETEVVAFYLQKNLNNKEFLARMARYNSSFFNRFFSNAISSLRGDAKTKLENLYLDAIADASTMATQELAPEYSVGSLFQAIGMTIHKESETLGDDGEYTSTFYAVDENGNKIRTVTEDMVANSPLGQMLQEAQARGFIEDASKQTEMVATIYNSMLKSQDPEMFWAVFGSIGFGRADVGTSSSDVSQSKHFASFTTNSDPQYGHTFDVTTICTKTQQLIDVASETMKRLDRGLTEDEVIDIVYNEVFKAGEPVPCPVCYVFSRWVGIGGVLENIKNFQEKYRNANLEELRGRYEVLSKQVDEIAEKRGIRGSKAIEELRKQTDQEVVDRYEYLFGKEIVDKMGGKKLSAEERAEFESLKKDLEVLNDWAWLTRVVLDVKVKKGVKTVSINQDYVKIGDVPNDILFDLNKGEDFAKYPAWKYRASRGQRYGKIIAPYSDMVLGQTIMGFASPSDSSIKSLGQKRSSKNNPFLDVNQRRKQNQLYKKAIENARIQNLKNGSRAQSTSDFRFEYITDYILHFMQLQSIGSYGQTYTKVPEAVPVLCSVGYEVNMSLMPKGKGYKPAKKGDPYTYYVEGFEGVKDGWYTIDCSSVTGINPDVAFYLRNQYDNAQTIMVGINDVHLFLCRQDPRIDFIIPYHASGGSAEHYVSMMNTVREGTDLDANDRVDYSEASNENEERLSILTEDQKYAYELREKILTQNLPNPTEEEINFMKKGTGILWDLWNRFYVEGVDDRCYKVNMGKKPAIFPYEYWDETSTRKDADINGMRYVQYCKELGYKPKFESLSNGDGSGGYWKYLPDRSMYNVNGTSHIQKAINLDDFSSDFLYKGKIQEGIIQPIAEQENIPMDETNPLYQELRKRVLSQQFDKTKTNKIVENVLKRIENGELDAEFNAGGIEGLKNLLKYGTEEEQSRAIELLNKQSDAERMESEMADGKPRYSQSEIYQQTGWIRKSDGKWRWQFFDGAEKTIANLTDFLKSASEASGDEDVILLKKIWSDIKTESNGNIPYSIKYRLSRFVGNDNIIFRMYPHLKDTKVQFYLDNDDGNTHGSYSARNNLITLNLGNKDIYLAEDNGEAIIQFGQEEQIQLANTFFHELQHAIQKIEHFEGGSNMEQAEQDLISEKNDELYKKCGEILDKVVEMDVNPEDFFRYVKDFRDSKPVDNIPEELLDLVEEYASLRWEIDNLGLLIDKDEVFDIYQNTLGEIEAREAGMMMTRPETRVEPVSEGYISRNRPYQFEIGEGYDPSESASYDVPHVEGEVTDGYGPRKTQRFASSNIPKSNIFSEGQQEQIRQDIEDGLFTQIGAYNKVELQRAREYMERDGVDETFESFMQNDRPDMKSVVKGTVLLEYLAKNNDPRWHEVAVKMANDATTAGKFLQAYAIMQRLSPEGQLMVIRRTMRRMQQDINNRFGDNAPQLELKPELEQELRDAPPEKVEEVTERIRQDLENQIPKTVRDWINSWRYLAMLGNPRTHVRNFAGNGIFVPAVTLKNIIGTGLENIFIREGNKSKAILNRFSESDQALIKLGEQAYEEYKGAIEKNQMKYEKKDFPDKGLGKLLNWLSSKNSWLLDKSDFLFAKARYASSYAQYLKANKMTADSLNPEMTAKANAYAIREALRATYRDANAVAEWLNELEYSNKKGLKMASYVKDAIMPFTKTPMNIVKRGVRYSPVGLLYTVVHDANELHNGKIDANDFLDNLAQGLTGTSIAILGAWLRSLGLFRTKDDDKDRKQYFDSENGEQDYAIDLSPLGVEGTYTIDWATPVIMPFAIGSELWDVFKDFEGVDGFESALDAVADISAKIMDPVMETSMLSSLQDALKSYSTSGGAWLGDMVMSMASSYILQMFPTIGGQFARTIDDTRRTTYPNKGKLDKMVRQIYNKIPWMSQLNQPYINRRGQEEKNEGGNMLGRAFLNMLSPGYYSSKDLDKYDDEIYRLYESTGELDAFPSSSSSSVTFDKETMKFSPEEYTEWHKTRWQTEEKYVNQFIDSQSYKSLSDEERIKTIADIRGYAQKVAKRQFLESKGYTFVDSKEEYEERSAKGEKVVYDKELVNATGATDNGIDLYAYYDYLNNGGTKQAEKMAYLESSGLSDEQKKYLWGLSDYKTSYKDYKSKNSSKSSNSSSGKNKSSSGSKKASSSTTKVKKGSVSSSGIKQNLIGKGRAEGFDGFNNYLKAYSNVFKGSTAKGSTGNATVVCPRCRNRVPAGVSRCPNCGTKL